MKKHFSLLAAALLVCGVAFGQDSKPSKEEVVKEIDNYIQEVMDTWKIPGMAAAFSLDNQPLFAKGYGVKEVRPAEGMVNRVNAIASW